MNRRDIFKLFGVGAMVVPVINGMPHEEARSLIVEPPRVEPVEFTVHPPRWDDFGKCDVMVFARDQKTGTVMSMQCEAFIASANYHIVDVTTSMGTLCRRKLPTYVEVSFVATGEVKQRTFTRRA